MEEDEFAREKGIGVAGVGGWSAAAAAARLPFDGRRSILFFKVDVCVDGAIE